MHISGIKSNSITPLRRPFETFVSGGDEIYKSADRWRSKCYSSGDDYLSPSFLDDTCSLSSSPIFYDETPNTIFDTPTTSPCRKNSNSRKIRVSIDSAHTNSNENTPKNHPNYKRSASISTPMLTPPSAKSAVHDEEGFLIPDLPGTSRRRHYKSRNRNDVSESYGEYQSTDQVHITMPPRLGSPSQTPLNMKDQYRKSPLPVVSANLDYRTAYMGDRLAMRAKELRRNCGTYLRETSPMYQNNKYEYFDHSYSDDPTTICEDDLVLHHGEILRNRYSKLYKTSASSNHMASDVRSRSLSSYYSGSVSRKTYSPGYRSNSVAINNHSLFGNLRSNNKRRRLGSYISNQSDMLQQHIQLIDKSLERCSNNDSAHFESEAIDSPHSNNYIYESGCSSKGKSSHLSDVDLELESESIKPVSNKSNGSTSGNRSSHVVCDPETTNHLEDNVISSSRLSDNRELISGSLDSGKPSDSPLPTDHDAPFDLIFDSSVNECDGSFQNPSIAIATNSSNKCLASASSNSSLDEIVPHPIPTSSEICGKDIDEVVFEIDSSAKDDRFGETRNIKKSRQITKRTTRTNDQKKNARCKTINRRRHIDYHIPIDQVKPLSGATTKQLLDDSSNFDGSSRRYPKRLRTAPLKWYLGERLEYQRDEKNELGYTIAAIHKVANPKMLPNERGSIHPNNDVSKSSQNPNTEEHGTSEKNYACSRSRRRPDNTNTSRKVKLKEKRNSEGHKDKSNAVVLKDHDTNEEFSMISVFDRNELCWADVEYTAGKPYNVALSFISSQATCCEICLPPLTEKGLDESQDNYILGHVYMAPDNKSLQIMISDNNIYNIGIGDWFLIPDNTNYNFSNTSDNSEVYISLYVIKDS